MDFTKKDARRAAEKAQFCHLRDQETGKFLMDGDKPVGVMVLGAQARSVQEMLKHEGQRRMMSAKTKDEEARALEDTQRDFIRSASKLTTEFVNVQRCEVDADGEIILNDDGTPKREWDAKAPDDCEWFYDLNFFSVTSLLAPKDDQWQGLSYAQQVVAFSNKIGNYLGNG